MKVQGAMITRVAKANVQSSNNIAITMNNGDVMWTNLRYCQAVLSSLFLDGASPKALEGSTVSYEKRVHKAGDKATNADGSEVKGVTFSKDGYRLFQFQIQETGAKAQALEEVGYKTTLEHGLKGALSALKAPAVGSGAKGSDTQHNAVEQREISDEVNAESTGI